MEPDERKRSVTAIQLQRLLEFMRANPELARGLSRGRHGQSVTTKAWDACATNLNAMNGAVKDGKGWSKYWCDWKYRVRRHAVAIRVASTTKGLPPEALTPLTPLEKVIMNIIGDSSIESVVVQSDPLLVEGQNEQEDSETNQNEATYSQVDHSTGRGIKRPRVSAGKINEEASNEDGDDSNDEEQLENPSLQQQFGVEQLAKSDERKRSVTTNQLQRLLDFMRVNPELARGLSLCRYGQPVTTNAWDVCATNLNEMNGAVKDGEGWSKYWCDWKYHVRRHAVAVRIASTTKRLHPEGLTPLTPLEKVTMSIIGDSSIESVVVQSDPLLEEGQNEEEEPETNENEATYSQVNRVTILEASDEDDVYDDDGNEEEPENPSQQQPGAERLGLSDTRRRNVTAQQMQALMTCMRLNSEVARGYSRGRRAKLMADRVWQECATKLNAMKDGAVKDAKGWSEYWGVCKHNVRRHALEIKVACDTNKLPVKGLTALAPFEQIILAIIGDSTIEGFVTITDPLEPDTNEDEESEAYETEPTTSQMYQARPPAKKRRRVSADETNDNNENYEEEPENHPQQEQVEELDNDEETTAQFLRLEEMQLENAKQMQQSMGQISVEIRKLSDIMGDIRDVLLQKLHNLL